MKTFHVEIIKPTHYDRDGYPIQWWKAWIPSNSMACLHAIASDCAEKRVLGEDVAIEVDAYDEMNIKIPVERIAAQIQQPGHGGVVCLVGVQSNQFPRAMAIARRFRSKGVAVAIGGFHVSGCLAMLKTLTPELVEARDLGIILFAGEAEEHFASFLRDVAAGAAQPIYNYMDDLPDMRGQTIPDLPLRDRPALRRRAVIVRRRPRLPVPVLVLHDHQCTGQKIALARRRRHRANPAAERQPRRVAVFCHRR